MKERIVVVSMELTPIETNSDDNSITLFNDEITLKKERRTIEKGRYPIVSVNGFSDPKVIRYPSEIGNGSIDDKHSSKTRPNQVGIVMPRNEDTTEALSQKDQEKFASIWDTEKAWHEENASARESAFETILHDKDTEFSFANASFYTFATILAVSLISIPYFILPAHDIVRFPKYWYEILYHGSLISVLDLAFWTIFAGEILNMRHLKQFKTLLIVCLSGIGVMILFDISTYYIWTLVFNFQYPIPFFGYINTFLCRVFCCVAIWFMIPTEWHSHEGMRKRMICFILFLLATCIYNVYYQILIVTTRISRGRFQPLIALAFPASREGWNWFLRKFPKYCANGDERGAMIMFLYAFYTNHTMCLSYVIGSIAEDATSWVLMATDFILNIYDCLEIVKARKRNPSAVTNLIDQLQELSIAELAEFQSPLITTLVFAFAFYTPMGGLIGNVRNDYWAYEAVDDINNALANMIVFFFIELACTVATYVILRIYCKINCLKIVGVIQKEFFNAFIMSLGFITLGVNR